MRQQQITQLTTMYGSSLSIATIKSLTRPRLLFESTPCMLDTTTKKNDCNNGKYFCAWCQKLFRFNTSGAKPSPLHRIFPPTQFVWVIRKGNLGKPKPLRWNLMDDVSQGHPNSPWKKFIYVLPGSFLLTFVKLYGYIESDVGNVYKSKYFYEFYIQSRNALNTI